LAVPKALEEEILDALLSLPTLAPGFTVVPGQGIGRHVELASTMEQVQGRARRVLVQVAMEQAQVQPLIDTLRAALPSPQVAYWVVPLLTFGRFGDLP
jgi:nitrogen regulatory protein PII